MAIRYLALAITANTTEEWLRYYAKYQESERLAGVPVNEDDPRVMAYVETYRRDETLL